MQGGNEKTYLINFGLYIKNKKYQHKIYTTKTIGLIHTHTHTQLDGTRGKKSLEIQTNASYINHTN